MGQFRENIFLRKSMFVSQSKITGRGNKTWEIQSGQHVRSTAGHPTLFCIIPHYCTQCQGETHPMTRRPDQCHSAPLTMFRRTGDQLVLQWCTLCIFCFKSHTLPPPHHHIPHHAKNPLSYVSFTQMHTTHPSSKTMPMHCIRVMS